MKKLIFTIVLMLGAISVYAQLGGTVSYSTFDPNRSYQQQQPQSQTIRVIAYALNSTGDGYLKSQLKIQVVDSGNMQQLTVVEQYVSNPYGGGYWQRAYAGVQNCNVYSSNNPLEAQFMKKAMINGRYYYFDL